MNHPEEYKLNNPVWYAINETHKPYGIDYPNAHFYHPDYSSFGGFTTFENTDFVLENYAEKANSFFIFGLVPSMPKTLEIKQELICHQMIVCTKQNTFFACCQYESRRYWIVRITRFCNPKKNKYLGYRQKNATFFLNIILSNQSSLQANLGLVELFKPAKIDFFNKNSITKNRINLYFFSILLINSLTIKVFYFIIYCVRDFTIV